MLQPGLDVRRLFLQTRPQNLPVVRILQERLLVAGALDLVPQFERAIILADGKLPQPPGEGPDQGPQVAPVILDIPDCLQPGIDQHLLRDCADAVQRPDRQRTQESHLRMLGRRTGTACQAGTEGSGQAACPSPAGSNFCDQERCSDAQGGS